MKELYREFFYIPKHGKIREKVMITRVTMIVVIMIACLVAMSFTAYAYFSAEDVVVPNNYIGSAKYDLDIQVTDAVLTENTFTAEAGKTYTVSLKYISGSAQTGFCGIKIGENVYHTEQIGKDEKAENGRRDETEFSIAIEGTGSITVELIPHWGTSSRYDQYSERGENDEFYITKKEIITLNIVDGVVPEIYIAKSGDSLWSIAQAYGTTVDKLAAYNNITKTDSIAVRQPIKIPPASWEIPVVQNEAPTQETTTVQNATQDPAPTQEQPPLETNNAVDSTVTTEPSSITTEIATTDSTATEEAQ